MDKQNIRMFLLLAILVVGSFLYNTWMQEHSKVSTAVTTESDLGTSPAAISDVPVISPVATKAKAQGKKPAENIAVNKQQVIKVTTDVMQLKIAKTGGDIVFLELLNYPVSLQQKNQGFVLLNTNQERNYIVQSGLLSEAGPDSRQHGRALYQSEQQSYRMDNNELTVDLLYMTAAGVKIIKRFTFVRGSYAIKVEYLLFNTGTKVYKANFYGRLRRSAPDKEASKGMVSKTYTGAAISTPSNKYQKITFADMEKKPFKQSVEHGWLAMEEHYFTTAWVPGDGKYQYLTETFADHTYSIGMVGSVLELAPGAQTTIAATLYAGPEIMENLAKIAPGLELTVDYGVLWWICQPIFYLMNWLYGSLGNWGWAIILVTVLIKLAFYKLSAASYRSMGNMKKLQPKMEQLKAQHGDDRQKFGQAVMELYRKEKVNPLGGCLPILVQIPVFIALYYVLLESVELRQAPFMFWLQDLSVKDPYYILPVIMGISMFLQQRMNPAPADPVQAKVMLAMPIIFTVMFLQFPSGLVLYWVVNNVISIVQQWFITKRMEQSCGKK